MLLQFREKVLVTKVYQFRDHVYRSWVPLFPSSRAPLAAIIRPSRLTLADRIKVRPLSAIDTLAIICYDQDGFLLVMF